MKITSAKLEFPEQPPVDRAAWDKIKADAAATGHAVGWRVKGCEKCPPIVVPTRPARAP